MALMPLIIPLLDLAVVLACGWSWGVSGTRGKQRLRRPMDFHATRAAPEAESLQSHRRVVRYKAAARSFAR